MASSANAMAQLGPVSFLPCVSTRRKIEAADVRWAEAKRDAGWGWQAIAGALRVNREDLKALVEGGRAATGDLVPPPPPRLRADTLLAAVLLHLAAGGSSAPRALGKLMRRSPIDSYRVTGRLVELRLLRGSDLALTPAGVAEAGRLKAEVGRG